MLERTVDFNDMLEGGKFSFTFPHGVTVDEVDEGIILVDELGNKCHAKFFGIQSQRDYTLAVVLLEPETWNGAFPPDKVRELKSL